MSVTVNPLIVTLRKAVDDLRAAEQNLGAVDGSFGWNTVYEKVCVAERAYATALKAVETALQGTSA